MKPQELNIECEVFDELREKLNAAIHSLVDNLIKKELPSGTVAAKIGIEIIKHTDKETGEIMYMPEFKPDVSLKVGAKGKIECSKICGLILKKNMDGEHIVGSNQIEMDEMLAEEKGA